MSYCSYVGNFKDNLPVDSIIEDYPLGKKQQYDWDPVRYNDLPDEI